MHAIVQENRSARGQTLAGATCNTRNTKNSTFQKAEVSLGEESGSPTWTGPPAVEVGCDGGSSPQDDYEYDAASTTGLDRTATRLPSPTRDTAIIGSAVHTPRAMPSHLSIPMPPTAHTPITTPSTRPSAACKGTTSYRMVASCTGNDHHASPTCQLPGKVRWSDLLETAQSGQEGLQTAAAVSTCSTGNPTASLPPQTCGPTPATADHTSADIAAAGGRVTPSSAARGVERPARPVCGIVRAQNAEPATLASLFSTARSGLKALKRRLPFGRQRTKESALPPTATALPAEIASHPAASQRQNHPGHTPAPAHSMPVAHTQPRQPKPPTAAPDLSPSAGLQPPLLRSCDPLPQTVQQTPTAGFTTEVVSALPRGYASHPRWAAAASLGAREGWACSSSEVNLDGDVLGQGGFGTVYSGSLTGKRCAVKCLWGRTKVDDNIFLNELQALASMRRNPHRNILKLMGAVVEPPRRCWLITEACDCTLQDWIERQQRTSLEKLDMAVGVACGLQALHCASPSAIVHLDLKPENILIGNDGRPRIADFGLSRLLESQAQEARDLPSGSDCYMAPEHYLHRKAGLPADIFGLSMVLLEILTQKLVYKKERKHGTEKVVEAVAKEGMRPQMPGGLGRLAPLLESCWHHDTCRRPGISHVVHVLRQKQKLQRAHDQTLCR